MGASMIESRPCGAVVLPGGEHILGRWWRGRRHGPGRGRGRTRAPRVAVAQGEGGGGFGGVGEPEQLGEPDRAVGGLDVAEHAAGADRGELLVVTDQPDTAAPLDDVADRGVEGEGVGHAGLVDHHQGGRRRCRPPSPAASPLAAGSVVSLARVSVVGVDLHRASTAAAAADGASPMTVPPPCGPGGGEGAHRGGLAGAGGRDRELQPGTRGGHLADQRGLSGVQGDAVGGRLQQRQVDRGVVDGVPVAAAGGGDQALLGGEDPRRGEQVGAGDGVDRGAVGPPQQLAARDRRRGRARADRPAVQHLVDEQVDEPVGLRRSARRRRGPGAAPRRGRARSARWTGVPPSPTAPDRPSVSTQPASSIPWPSMPAGLSALATIELRRASGPPSTSAACAEPGRALLGQGARFVLGLAGLQGGLLGQLQRSTGVGGRPWSRWNSAASTLRRVSMSARRVDHRVFSAGSTPTISRTGRFRGSWSGRSANRTPEAVAEVLLEGGVVGLRGGDVGLEQHPAVDASQRPSRVWTLLATATWVCRSGSPARESRWVNAAATRPRTLTCRTPLARSG